MKHKLLCGLLGLSVILQTAGCGTVMFSHRHGQPAGRVDPNIVILDGIGLFFFIIPGLVAYAVDFASGAIYLPEDVERGEGPFIHDSPSTETEETEETETTETPEEPEDFVGPPVAPESPE